MPRGISLSEIYDESIAIIEVYPASVKILEIQRKNKVRGHFEDAKIAVTATISYEGKCERASGRFYIPGRITEVRKAKRKY